MRRVFEPPATFEEWCTAHHLRCSMLEGTSENGDVQCELELLACDEPPLATIVRAPRGVGKTPKEARLRLMERIRGQRFVANERTPNRREFSAPDRWIHDVDVNALGYDEIREQLRIILQSCPRECRVADSVAGTVQNYLARLEATIGALKLRLGPGSDEYFPDDPDEDE